MEICMKEILKKLRQSKNVTQEQLANHIGITPQSVGKWERGEGYPDITLLPTIALYFGVTVDELLGFSKACIKQKIEEYEKKSRELLNKGNAAENLALWKEAYNMFPEEYHVQNHYIQALWSVCKLKPIMVIDGVMQPWDDQLLREKGEEILAVGEHLLMTCTDRVIMDTVTNTLCDTAMHMGNTELARTYAEKLGSYYCTKEAKLEWVLEGKESIAQSQDNILAYLQMLTFSIRAVGIKICHKPEESETFARLIIELWEKILGTEQLGPHHKYLADAYYSLSVDLALQDKEEECICALENMVRHVILLIQRKDGVYAQPWLNGKTYSFESAFANGCFNYSKYLLENTAFDTLRQSPRFMAVVNNLEDAAKEIE